MIKFINARSWGDYESAKRSAARLDVVYQLALVDSIIAARKRLERAEGRVAA